MKRFLISGVLFSIIFGISAIAVTAQLPGLERIRRQRERAIQAEQQREEDKRREEAGLAPKRPKPAVMNVDVQAVLAKAEYKDFNEAKANAVNKIADGEPLWLYVKFVKGKLGDYVLTVPTDQPDVSRSLLYAEIGPQGDATTQYQYTLQFTKDDLALTELKLNLAPGISGRGRSMPLFLSAAAASRPGVWNNELRLTNTTAIPRGADQNLTKNVITFSFAGSLVKYPQMAEDYESIMLRGTADKTRLPIGSGFYDAAIKEQDLPTTKGVKGWVTVDQAQRYDGNIEVEFRLDGTVAGAGGSGMVQVNRGQSVAENISIQERDRTWTRMEEAMVSDLDVNAQKMLRNRLPFLLK